jgi:glycosyltransferase involved in cell wall biosynthesis
VQHGIRVTDRFRIALASAGRRILTARMRRRLRWGYVRLAEPQLRQYRSLRKRTIAKGVTIAGQLDAPSGLGAGARAFAKWFARQGAPVHGLNVNIYSGQTEIDRLPTVPRHHDGLVLCVANPPHLAEDLIRVKRARLRPSYLVAHWVWELAHCPREWSRFDRLVDEIWVPSEFVRNAVSSTLRCPVRVVPYPLPRPSPSTRSLESFGLPHAEFVVLTAFDFRSGFYRKNVLASIRSFRIAFGNDRRALFVVKIDGHTYEPNCARALFEAIGDSPNIVVLNDILSADDMSALIGHCHAILSLHRSEGFGLLLAEAMLQSKPVVATGWSGNLQFMDSSSAILVPYSLVEIEDPQGIYAGFDGKWAEPDVESAAASLRNLAADLHYAAAIGQKGFARASAVFDDGAISAAMAFGTLPWP